MLLQAGMFSINNKSRGSFLVDAALRHHNLQTLESILEFAVDITEHDIIRIILYFISLDQKTLVTIRMKKYANPSS